MSSLIRSALLSSLPGSALVWRRRTWAALWLLLALIIGTALVWLTGADRTIGQTVWTGRPINLYNTRTIGQVFRPPADGLHRVDLMFLSYALIRTGSVDVTIADESGRPLLRRSIDSSMLRDSWYGVEFPALDGVAGREIRLELERERDWRSPIGIRVAPGGLVPGHGLLRGERDDSFDLTFRAYLATPAGLSARWERVVEAAQALTTARPGPYGQPAFLLLLGGAYAGGLAGLACLVVAVQRS